MKKGFILLEVLIASAISTFILAMITSVVYQTNNSFARMSKISSIEMRALLIQHQMERDLSGAFVPYVRKEKKEQSTAVAGQAAQKASGASVSGKQSEQKKQYEDVPLKDAFLSKNKNKNLELVTCITSNPIPVYDVAKSRIARVVYTLVPDKVRGKQPPSFRLFRQEDVLLDLKAFMAKSQTGVRSYEVVKHVKRMTVKYTVTVKKGQASAVAKAMADKQDETNKKASQKTATETKEEEIEYKTFDQWTEKEVEQTKRQRPDFCLFTVELWDDAKKSSDSFEFSVYIFQGEYSPQEKKKKKEPKKADEKKTKSSTGSQAGQVRGGSGSGNMLLSRVFGRY